MAEANSERVTKKKKPSTRRISTCKGFIQRRLNNAKTKMKQKKRFFCSDWDQFESGEEKKIVGSLFTNERKKRVLNGLNDVECCVKDLSSKFDRSNVGRKVDPGAV